MYWTSGILSRMLRNMHFFEIDMLTAVYEVGLILHVTHSEGNVISDFNFRIYLCPTTPDWEVGHTESLTVNSRRLYADKLTSSPLLYSKPRPISSIEDAVSTPSSAADSARCRVHPE